MVILQKQWISLPHLYSTSYLKLVFKGPTSHYLWALKYPFYWNTVCWKEWVLVLESLNFQPNGTSLWHRNGLFKLGLHFHFPIAWGRAGAQWAGQGKRPEWAGDVDSCPHSSLPDFSPVAGNARGRENIPCFSPGCWRNDRRRGTC